MRWNSSGLYGGLVLLACSSLASADTQRVDAKPGLVELAAGPFGDAVDVSWEARQPFGCRPGSNRVAVPRWSRRMGDVAWPSGHRRRRYQLPKQSPACRALSGHGSSDAGQVLIDVAQGYSGLDHCG